MKSIVEKNKKRLVKFAELVHLKLFGHEMSDTMREFLGNLSIVSVGMIISSVAMFIVYIIGARMVGAIEFGKFQLIYTMAQFITIPMLFGLNTASIKYIAEEKVRAKQKEYVGNALLLVGCSIIFTWTVLIIGKNYFYSIFNINQQTFILLMLLSTVIVAYYFSRSLLQGLGDMAMLSFLEGGYATVIIISFFALYYYNGSNYFALYWAFILGYLFFVIFFVYKYFTTIQKNYHKNVQFRKKIFKYGLFAILGSVSGILLSGIDKIMLGYYTDVKTVGVYSIYVLASLVVFSQILHIFITVFFPQLSAIQNKKNIVVKINKSIRLIFLLISLMSSITIPVVLYFAGKDYPFRLSYIIIFSTITGLTWIYQLKMWVLNSIGIQGIRITVKGTLFVGIVNAILNRIFIFKWGMNGALVATVISSSLLYIYFTSKLNKLLIRNKTKV